MNAPAVRRPVRRSARLVALLIAFALVLGSCSNEDSTEHTLDSAFFPAEDAVSGGERDESPEVTTPPGEETSTTAPGDERPISPPGTVNDLDDLIGNESEDGLGSQRDGTRVDRFVIALLADTGELEISEAEARCAGEMIEEQFSETSFELLVTNLETINEIEDGTQFTDAELTVISESLANCIDFRPLVDELVGDHVELGSLVDCLAGQVGIDGVEALFLFEAVGENSHRLVVPVFLEGLELCPNEARAAIDEAILDQFLLADGPAIEACLADISTAELRPFFETREFSELIAVLRDQCLF